MGMVRVVAVIVLIIGAFAGGVMLFARPAAGVYIFSGIEGPELRSVLPKKTATPWSNYHGGSDSRLAILLTESQSNWLGLAHGFKSIGIPFSITADYREAIHHKVVMLYPTVSGAVLNAEALQALAEFTNQGGTLIGFGVLGGDMPQVFGFEKAVPFHLRTKLKFIDPAPGTDPMEKEIPLDNPDAGADSMGAYGYTSPVELPLAVYEDDSAAIITHMVGRGRAIGFGFDLGALLLKGYNDRQENMARSYDNGYEPTLDILLRLVASIYRQGEDRAVTLSPVPDGKKLAVMITHDIDYTRSLANAVNYAAFEREAGIRATYFMQAKYIRDYNDDIILNGESPTYLKQLYDLGMEIGSHTVSHSRVFADFPMGDGTETYPAYRPFVENKETTSGGTIFGELRVSRFLLEHLVPGLYIESFRPGYLANPYGLPQALAATDYRFSSSVTANDSLTHLPFQLDYARETMQEVPVFEFPVSLSDGPGLLTDKLPDGAALARRIARRSGIFVVLIHPDTVEPKLGFEKDFVANVKDFSWFGTISEFGRWWAARNALLVDSAWEGGKLIVRIRGPMPIEGLTLTPPAGLRAEPGQRLVKETNDQSVVLGKIEGSAEVVFVR
jgi:peptidoglycan/xylan/chitin deacetylase (PgdA/CDA1 family)